MTKQEIIKKLLEYGVDADPAAHFKSLEKQLAKVEEKLQPAGEAKESLPETESKSEQEDYLRPYQVRKGTVDGSRESDPQPNSQAERMKETLLRQPRVRTMIPRERGEDKTIKQTVTINGYRLDFPKNTYVSVPQQVADILQESLEQTEEALLRDRIEGNEEKEKALLG